MTSSVGTTTRITPSPRRTPLDVRRASSGGVRSLQRAPSQIMRATRKQIPGVKSAKVPRLFGKIKRTSFFHRGFLRKPTHRRRRKYGQDGRR